MKRARDEGDPEPRARRHAKMKEPAPPRDSSRFVLVASFDDHDRPVEVDTQLLEPYECRLLKQIRHDPPYRDLLGRPFWRCNMSKDMLMTFVRSLTHGQLSLGKNTSLPEALTTFEYEGVRMGDPASRRAEVRALRAAQNGVAFPKKESSQQTRVAMHCELLADALARWPRLEIALDNALSGGGTPHSATAHRVWIRFSPKPVLYRPRPDSDPILLMANQSPRWLIATLVAIGHVHRKLLKDRVLETDARDEAAYKKLSDTVLGDGCFFYTVFDRPTSSMDPSTRKEAERAERFAAQIRNTVLNQAKFVPTAEEDPSPEAEERREAAHKKLQFSRACFGLAEQVLNMTCSLTTTFSSDCADALGKTQEREQLARALRQRNVKIVGWSRHDADASRPLIFPPTWAKDPVSNQHAAVLLDFSQAR